MDLHIDILEFIAGVCLDSNWPKPITYNHILMSDVLQIKLPSRIESVEDAAAKAAEFAGERGFGDEVIGAIDLPVRESVVNAVKHGNKFDESKAVEVKFAAIDEGLEITIRDHGEGFSVDDIPDPTNPENLLKESGRGIMFMRAFMDEVEYSNAPDGGTIVKMLKKR